MRPKRLDDLTGQQHLAGKNSILRMSVEQGNVPSMILWGPPGVGKTTIANIIANEVKRPFQMLSAVSAGVKDVREVIDQARRTSRVILFIDEIHRFNKSQQDALLGAVEKGTITLIGATTENPSFEVNSALLSRCQVYTLKALDEGYLVKLVEQALAKDIELKNRKITVNEYQALINISGGDARKLLNLIELISESISGDIEVTNDLVMQVAQKHIAIYDKSGEQHYDIISAFIKSIRGSDPDAALYYLARMLDAGEDPLFLARRVVRMAVEDIGLADPQALVIANAAKDAFDFLGSPEGELAIAQAVVYCATAPKSNAMYSAFGAAMRTAKEAGSLPRPDAHSVQSDEFLQSMHVGSRCAHGWLPPCPSWCKEDCRLPAASPA